MRSCSRFGSFLRFGVLRYASVITILKIATMLRQFVDAFPGVCSDRICGIRMVKGWFAWLVCVLTGVYLILWGMESDDFVEFEILLTSFTGLDFITPERASILADGAESEQIYVSAVKGSLVAPIQAFLLS